MPEEVAPGTPVRHRFPMSFLVPNVHKHCHNIILLLHQLCVLPSFMTSISVPTPVYTAFQTATPGRQAHPLRQVSLLGGSKKEAGTKKDSDITSPRTTSHAEASTGPSSGLTGSATDNEACFNMVNFILGAGVLGYPFCYKACGLVLTTLLILVCLIAAQLSMRLLLTSSQLSGKRTYEELARLTFGKPGQRVMGTCVFMLNLGALVAYVNILADVLSSVAGSIIPPGAEPSRNIIMTGSYQLYIHTGNCIRPSASCCILMSHEHRLQHYSLVVADAFSITCVQFNIRQLWGHGAGTKRIEAHHSNGAAAM